jgi:hypothetical protein
MQITADSMIYNLSLQLNWGTERQKCLGYRMKVSKNGFENSEVKKVLVHAGHSVVL